MAFCSFCITCRLAGTHDSSRPRQARPLHLNYVASSYPHKTRHVPAISPTLPNYALQSIQRHDTRLSAGSESAAEAAAAAAAATAATAVPNKIPPTVAGASTSDTIGARVTPNHRTNDSTSSTSSASTPVARDEDEEEEGKEAEGLARGGGARSPVPVLPGVGDGASPSIVEYGPDDRREDVAGGGGKTVAASTAVDKLSVGADPRNLNKTGYRLKGIVVSSCRQRRRRGAGRGMDVDCFHEVFFFFVSSFEGVLFRRHAGRLASRPVRVGRGYCWVDGCQGSIPVCLLLDPM